MSYVLYNVRFTFVIRPYYVRIRSTAAPSLRYCGLRFLAFLLQSRDLSVRSRLSPAVIRSDEKLREDVREGIEISASVSPGDPLTLSLLNRSLLLVVESEQLEIETELRRGEE